MNNDETREIVRQTIMAMDQIQDEVYEAIGEYKWKYWFSGFAIGCTTGLLLFVIMYVIYIEMH